MYTTSWGLFLVALPVSLISAFLPTAASITERAAVGSFFFAVQIGIAILLHSIAERITKRRHGTGISGFTYRL